MRTNRMVIAVALLAQAVSVGWSGPNARITISGGTVEQRVMARWAVGRFDAAGLSLPPMAIRFHLSRDECAEHLGYYQGGVANMCGIHVNEMSRRTLLHEMAHGWLEVNVTGERRARFLRARGLGTWNGQEVPWGARGFEQGADIVSWALHDQGTGILLPSIPDNAPGQLARAYVLLTGLPLPT